MDDFDFILEHGELLFDQAEVVRDLFLDIGLVDVLCALDRKKFLVVPFLLD